MRRGTIAIVSALIALLFVQPVSGKSKSVVSFSDASGDLGHPLFYVDDQGLLVPMAYWPDTSPVGSAEYLDMLQGEMRIGRDGVLTASLTVAEPFSGETVLPSGVTEVWWTWAFYKPNWTWWWDYAVYLCWDGSTFECLLMANGQEDPVGFVNSYSVVGDQIVVKFDADLVVGSTTWFLEVVCWRDRDPQTVQGLLPTTPMGAWYAVDVVDGPFMYTLPMPE